MRFPSKSISKRLKALEFRGVEKGHKPVFLVWPRMSIDAWEELASEMQYRLKADVKTESGEGCSYDDLKTPDLVPNKSWRSSGLRSI